MANLVFNNRYRLDPSGGTNYKIDSKDKSKDPATVLVREKPDGVNVINDDNSFDVGEAIQISLDGGLTWKNFTYLGTFEGGIVYGKNDKFFFLTNSTDPYPIGYDVSVALVSTPVCFLPGTLIATPDGPRAVETLKPGDLVLTPYGVQPVKFLARTTRRVNALRGLGKMPIRISAGALGELGPERDTFMSPSHAIHFEGHLVEAGALINGNSVIQLESWNEGDSITYYNIELELHSLIWINGLLAETYFANFRTNGFSRDSWDNYSDYIKLHGSSELMEELPMPRIPFARQLPVNLRVRLQVNESTPPARSRALVETGGTVHLRG